MDPGRNAPWGPLFNQTLTIFQLHMEALASVQSDDGRWHQLVNETGSWLETSGTAMLAHGYALGVIHGWLDRERYEPVLRKAWRGLASVITDDGKVAMLDQKPVLNAGVSR